MSERTPHFVAIISRLANQGGKLCDDAREYIESQADLIERQAAEIAELKKQLENRNADIRELTSGKWHNVADTAEIERLRTELNGHLGQPFGDPAKS